MRDFVDDPYLFRGKLKMGLIGDSNHHVCAMMFRKFGIAKVPSSHKVFCSNGFRELRCCYNCIYSLFAHRFFGTYRDYLIQIIILGAVRCNDNCITLPLLAVLREISGHCWALIPEQTFEMIAHILAFQFTKGG